MQRVNHTQFIAHRGASLEAPENTAESVALAWQQEVVAVEVDVQLTSDKQIVVFHDFDTKRMTGHAGLVKDQTRANLQTLSISAKGINTHIPLLVDLVMELPINKKLVVEIKCGSDILIPLTELFAQFSSKCKQLEFISFHKPSLEAVKQAFPKNRAFILYDKPSSPNPEYRFPGIQEMLSYMETHRIDGADLEDGAYITADLVDALHQQGKVLYIWTVDDLEEAKRLYDLGVDGITSNRAAWLKKKITMTD